MSVATNGATETRRQFRQSVQRIHPPRHIEIGTVSLPVSSRYIGLDFPAVRRNCFFHCTFIFFCIYSLLDLTTTLTLNFLNLINSSLVFWSRIAPHSTHSPNLKKIIHNFQSYPAKKLLNRQTNKHRGRQYPDTSGVANKTTGRSCKEHHHYAAYMHYE